MRHGVVHLLLAGVLLAGGRARADEPLKPRSPARLILRQLKMQNADLDGALQTLRQEAEKQSGGTVKIAFALDLPKDFKPLYELTLELHNIPFPDALRCVGELAGVDFFAQGDTIVVRARRAAPAAPAIAAASPQISLPTQGQTGALGKPPERVGGGGGVRRALDGSVQPEQSGHVAHRALDGWSTEVKQEHVFDANCVHTEQCPGGCGCFACACKKAPKK